MNEQLKPFQKSRTIAQMGTKMCLYMSDPFCYSCKLKHGDKYTSVGYIREKEGLIVVTTIRTYIS